SIDARRANTRFALLLFTFTTVARLPRQGCRHIPDLHQRPQAALRVEPGDRLAALLLRGDRSDLLEASRPAHLHRAVDVGRPRADVVVGRAQPGVALHEACRAAHVVVRVADLDHRAADPERLDRDRVLRAKVVAAPLLLT